MNGDLGPFSKSSLSPRREHQGGEAAALKLRPLDTQVSFNFVPPVPNVARPGDMLTQCTGICGRGVTISNSPVDCSFVVGLFKFLQRG